MLRILPAILLVLLLAASESAVQLWRRSEPKPSTAPLFFWKDARLVTEAPRPFGLILEIYDADRGMESFQNLAEGVRLQTLYLEWDDIETGPFSALAGHESEVCGVVAGFTILESKIPRKFEMPGGQALDFHYARLRDPRGKIVHTYKIPWIQGYGAWHIDSSRDRELRLKRSFIRHRGAARVVQLSIFGIEDERAAWEAVCHELRAKLDWRAARSS